MAKVAFSMIINFKQKVFHFKQLYDIIFNYL